MPAFPYNGGNNKYLSYLTPRAPRSGTSAPNSGSSTASSSTNVWNVWRRRRKTNTTVLYIGGAMFCLVLVYVGVVIAVTRAHFQGEAAMQEQEQKNKMTSSLSGAGASVDSIIQRHQERLEQHQAAAASQQRQEQQQAQIPEKQQLPPRIIQQQEQQQQQQQQADEHDESNDNANDNNDNYIHIPDPHKDHYRIYKDDPPPDQHPTPDRILTAYLEAPNPDEWKEEPLPRRRKAQASLLEKRQYTRLSSCAKLIQQWPVDDDTPSEDDPFLPWIHDVFPTPDGQFIQFVAQNRKRCRTGSSPRLNETNIMMKMQPQVANFQHVSVRRVEVKNDNNNDNNNSDLHDLQYNQTATLDPGRPQRYRLSTYADADPDGLATRFICRFQPSGIETLSVFNFDYDWIAYRKMYRGTFDELGDGGIKSLHTSQLVFKCPVPTLELQEQIARGAHVNRDTNWTSLFVDLIPIRTAPRFGKGNRYLQPQYAEFQHENKTYSFDPVKTWGNQHLIPMIQDSGRWENIPICLPSLMQYGEQEIPAQVVSDSDNNAVPPPPPPKKHRLVSCIWASAGYSTRGNRYSIQDGQRRLLEWISYNKVIGFDHFYLYDNSGANADATTSLKPIADLFPGDITYVAWPSTICNNRPNNVPSPGERSSQYAAEASCRLRFGPHVDWIGQFDIDEYLIPMGKYETISSLLDDMDKQDTRILSFGSWRAWPRRAFIDEIHEIRNGGICWSRDPCFKLTIPSNKTMLQAYNCDRQPPGKKTETMPAEKQIYRAEYVTQHFVHYAAVTTLSMLNKTEYLKQGFRWKRRAFPDPRQRYGNEETEALMLHTKAVAIQDTAGWKRSCHVDNYGLPKEMQAMCRLGEPWPQPWPTNFKHLPVKGNKDGYAYNCFVNAKIEQDLVPRLEQEMSRHTPKLGLTGA